LRGGEGEEWKTIPRLAVRERYFGGRIPSQDIPVRIIDTMQS
jgi:hypothetical protein